MVTTLIARMSDLLTPISKTTTRTQSTRTNGSVRYLVGVKGAETKAKRSFARLSTEFQNGSRSLSKPCPAQDNSRVNHRNEN